MKPATLSSSLLIRKGTATPVPHTASPLPTGQPETARQERARARSSLRQVSPPQDEAAGHHDDHDLKQDHFGRVRLSIRLDPDRHLRLKLLAAHTRSSVQDLLIAALDAYLEDMGQSVNDGACACLGDPDGTPDDGHDQPSPKRSHSLTEVGGPPFDNREPGPDDGHTR